MEALEKLEKISQHRMLDYKKVL